MKKILISILFLFVCSYVFADVTTEQSLINDVNVAKTNKQKKTAIKELFNYYVNTNNYQQIIDVSEQVLNLKISKKYKYFVYVSKARAYLYNCEFENAVYFAKEAEYLYSKKIEAKLLLGIIYKENNLMELAIEKYLEVLSLDKKNILALTNLGDIYREQENYKKALEYYLQIEKNYKNVYDGTYYNMAVCQLELGHIKQAETILEQLYNKAKDKNKKVCLTLAKVYQIEGFYKQGQTLLENYISKNDQVYDVDIYCSLAQLYLFNKDYNKSKDLLLNFKSKNKTRYEIIDVLLAESYFSLNKKQQAINIINNILQYTKSEKIKKSLKNILKMADIK